MKRDTRTPQSNGSRAHCAVVLPFFCVVALLGCSPAGSEVHRAEASSAPAESRTGPPKNPEIDGTEAADAASEVPEPPVASSPRELLEWIVQGEFDQRQQVAVGRFLRDFDRLARIVDKLDRDELRPVSWGVNSSRFEAPVRDPLDFSPAGTAELRLVKHEGGWKLENVVVNRRQRIVRDGKDSERNN